MSESITESLKLAIMENDKEKFDNLLKNFPADKTTLGEGLRVAASNGRISMIASLLAAGADINYQNSSFPRTPLYEATFGIRPRTVLYLLQRGASKSIMDASGMTPIQLVTDFLSRIEEEKAVAALKKIQSYLQTDDISYLPELSDLSNDPFPTEVKININDEPHTFILVSNLSEAEPFLESVKIYNTNNHISSSYSDDKAKQLLRMIKKYDLCDGINIDYAKKSLKKCDFFVYMLTPKYKLLGFATVNIKSLKMGYRTNEGDGFYIELICANPDYIGVGKKLMGYIKEIAKLNSITEISLNSVPEATGFYNKQGFLRQNNNPSAKNGLIRMSFKSKGGKRTCRRKTHKARK